MSEEFKDFLIDSELGIHTTGRNDQFSDTHRYPYEPTAYSVLDQLIDSEYISKNDVVLDYGCGMGRVPIYLREKIGCHGYGIELVKDFYKKACENKNHYQHGEDITFIQGKAEKFNVPDDVTLCFFFNPFDLGIMRGVMKKILESYSRKMRTIKLFFYYPQDEYIAYLMSVDELRFEDEILCDGSKAIEENRNRIVHFVLE